MKASFNFAQLYDGRILGRIDLTPDPADKTYPLYHVFVPDVPPDYKGEITQVYLDSLKKVERVNPCLCHFVPIPELATEAGLKDYLKVFTPDRVATIDHIMTLPRSAHYISPYMRAMPKWSDTKVSVKDAVDLISSINDSLKNVSISLASGKIQEVEPQSILIGPGATDRTGTPVSTNGVIIVDQNVVASGTGIIDTWEVFFAIATLTTTVGTCYVVSGNYLTTRGYESLGVAAGGSKTTVTGKTTAVTTGDYPFVNSTGAASLLEKDNAGVGYWYLVSSTIPFTNTNFGAPIATRTASIYGTGTATAVGGSRGFIIG